LASPLNKNIFVVRLGRKLKKIGGLRQALNVSGNLIDSYWNSKKAK